jgi:(2Fe-2S) ferredoxin
MSRFQKHIFVCVNERPADHPRGCCLHKNSEAVREKFKEEIRKIGITSLVRTNSAGCLDACEFGASVVVYPEAVWYGNVTVDDVKEIVNEHILDGHVVERLVIKDPRYKSDEIVKPLER